MNAVRLRPPPAVPPNTPDVYRDRMDDAVRNLWVAPFYITADWGKPVLEFCNGHNRRMTATWRKIASALARLGIQVNGETVAFSRSGLLMNGQNRIQSAVSTGVPFPTLGVWGVPDDVFATYDSGKVRSSSDVLSIAKLRNTKVLASALTWQAAYEESDDEAMARPKPAIPNDQVVEMAMLNPDIADAVQVVVSDYRRVGFSPSLAAFLYARFVEKDRETAVTFFKRVMRNVMVPEVCHERLLIRRLERAGSEASPESPDEPAKQARPLVRRLAKGARLLTLPELAALTIKTWNNIRDGLPVHPNGKLYWLPMKNERFPRIK